MRHLFKLQWQRFRREPFSVLAMFVMSIVFVAVIGGFQVNMTVSVPTYFDESVEHPDRWLEQLNEAEGFTFFELDEVSTREGIALGKHQYGLHIMEDDYNIVVMAEGEHLPLLNQVVYQTFTTERIIDVASTQSGSPEQFRGQIEERIDDPPVKVVNEAPGMLESAPSYDHQLQTLFGMALFFAIYSIVFSLSKFAQEKQTGTLDRMILSPIKKWQVYLGHMAYSYIIGFTQIFIVFMMFKYLFGYELGEQYLAIILTIACYVFAFVAIGMLILGLTKSMQQLNAVVPIVSVSLAMIGGAFWPIEFVSHKAILSISKINPVTYAMEALKSVSMYGNNLADILQPLSVLLLIGVVCMGIGVNLIERRA
ncbi:ABC transporter permease [Aquisalibacillus elongatus]|uniref:ABC-2 type transport system permease protein n=1 Tax=Aquisalibacillus elongatus TaxID=485577 RepID=A0A3N5C9H6_9BACI|nr:ABC transporter permease [Aquisalibacillus elongatus]RPF53291.1 ABC-2 type transport system permease protein [Aquisalibacillus elongatus]